MHSFDNSSEAVLQRITSCDFNIPGIANAMLSHILQRQSSILKARDDIVHKNGMIIKRGSMGRRR